MNREIRFRVWNPRLNKFENSYSLTDSGFLFAIGPNLKLSIIKVDNNPETDLVVQQYTGINDKDDVEIYEGDIVTLWLDNYPFPSGRFLIKFDRGSFVLEEIEISGIAGISFPKSKPIPGYEHLHQEFKMKKSLMDFNGIVLEVIGNSVENPELLD